MATYFDEPTMLVYDSSKELRVNYEHIIGEHRERFPAEVTSLSDYQIKMLLQGAIENAKARVARNYKVAVPQYYKGRIQLLLPLCLSDAGRADLALLVEPHDDFYRASTCLTLDMAYNNARQLSRPDRDWLQP